MRVLKFLWRIFVLAHWYVVTLLCAETLVNVLDLIADGASVVETTAAIGGSPKSKIIFVWLADSADAGEFDAST